MFKNKLGVIRLYRRDLLDAIFLKFEAIVLRSHHATVGIATWLQALIMS